MIMLFPILGVILALAVLTYFPPIYVMDMGATTKSSLCSAFSYQPATNTVYCGNTVYSGVVDVRVR